MKRLSSWMPTCQSGSRLPEISGTQSQNGRAAPDFQACLFLEWQQRAKLLLPPWSPASLSPDCCRPQSLSLAALLFRLTPVCDAATRARLKAPDASAQTIFTPQQAP